MNKERKVEIKQGFIQCILSIFAIVGFFTIICIVVILLFGGKGDIHIEYKGLLVKLTEYLYQIVH